MIESAKRRNRRIGSTDFISERFGISESDAIDLWQVMYETVNVENSEDIAITFLTEPDRERFFQAVTDNGNTITLETLSVISDAESAERTRRFFFQDLRYDVVSSEVSHLEDTHYQAVCYLQARPEMKQQILNDLQYMEQESTQTLAYRQDLLSTGNKLLSPLGWYRSISDEKSSHDRYLNKDTFDYAAKFFQAKMMKDLLQEMYHASRTAVVMSLAQKVAGGGLKQSANIANSYVNDVSAKVMSHFVTQVSEIQTWHELKASLNTQRFHADKAFDRQILFAILFAAVGGIVNVKFRKKNAFKLAQFVSIAKTVAEFLVSFSDAVQKNEVAGVDSSNEQDGEKQTVFEGKGQSNRSRTTQSGGDGNLGMNYQVVNYQAKVEATYKLKTLIQALKTMVEGNQSEADVFKYLAESLGGMASDYKVSSSMSLLIETAKTTSSRVIDNRFAREEQITQRHNEKQDMHMKTFISAITVAIAMGAENIDSIMNAFHRAADSIKKTAEAGSRSAAATTKLSRFQLFKEAASKRLLRLGRWMKQNVEQLGIVLIRLLKNTQAFQQGSVALSMRFSPFLNPTRLPISVL